jgi:hypothetical protein
MWQLLAIISAAWMEQLSILYIINSGHGHFGYLITRKFRNGVFPDFQPRDISLSKGNK